MAELVINNIKDNPKGKTKNKEDYTKEYIKIIEYLEYVRKNQKPKLSKETVANRIGMTYVTYSKKTNFHYDFSLDEIIRICDILEIEFTEVIKSINI